MKNLDEKEYNNVYAIPANYTDSGKLLGGMIDTRNAIETVILVLALGYPESKENCRTKQKILGVISK